MLRSAARRVVCHLNCVGSAVADEFLLHSAEYNAITFLDNYFTWFTCPDFDVFTKKLHVSKLISKLYKVSHIN